MRNSPGLGGQVACLELRHHVRMQESLLIGGTEVVAKALPLPPFALSTSTRLTLLASRFLAASLQ